MMWFLGHNGVDSMNLWVMVWYGIAQHNTVWYAVTAAALARTLPAQETLGEGLPLLQGMEGPLAPLARDPSEDGKQTWAAPVAW